MRQGNPVSLGRSPRLVVGGGSVRSGCPETQRRATFVEAPLSLPFLSGANQFRSQRNTERARETSFECDPQQEQSQ